MWQHAATISLTSLLIAVLLASYWKQVQNDVINTELKVMPSFLSPAWARRLSIPNSHSYPTATKAAAWWADQLRTPAIPMEKVTESVLGHDHPNLDMIDALQRIVVASEKKKLTDERIADFQRHLEHITVVLIDDTGDAILEVDYHPNNALRYAFERLGLDGDSVSSLLPWKTRMEVGKEHIAMFSQPLGLSTEAFLE